MNRESEVVKVEPKLMPNLWVHEELIKKQQKNKNKNKAERKQSERLEQTRERQECCNNKGNL